MYALIALMAVTSTGAGVSIGLGASHAYLGAQVELTVKIVNVGIAIGLPPTLYEGAVPEQFRELYDPFFGRDFDLESDDRSSLPMFALSVRWPTSFLKGLTITHALAIGHVELHDRSRGGFLESEVTLVAPALTAGWRAYVGPIFFDLGLGPTLLIKFVRSANSFDQLEGRVEVVPMLDLEATFGIAL